MKTYPFVLVRDVFAGTARVVSEGDDVGFHENFIGEYALREEAEADLKELAGPDVYVVVYDPGAGRAKIVVENGISGNWRGSKHGHFRYISNHATRPEAEIALGRLLADD